MNNHPTTDQAIAKLDANPTLSAEFDRHRRNEAPNSSRREAVELALNALKARRTATACQAKANCLRDYARGKATDLAKATQRLLAKPKAALTIHQQYAAITDRLDRNRFRKAHWTALSQSQP